MTLRGVPWFIDGAEHGPEEARLLGFLAMGGNDGVVQPNDFKVTASPIPDGNIHIAPGAMGFKSRFAGADSQGYLVRNDGDQPWPLDPQGSAGPRYDLITIITEDPDYAGQPAPADVEDGPYNHVKVYKGVPAATKFIQEVDADQSGYAIARVKFDASDGTVNPVDITDLRQLVSARRKEEIRIANPDVALDMAAAAYATFPTQATFQVDVPEWATRVILEADWSGISFTDTAAAAGSAVGWLRGKLGAIFTGGSAWKIDGTGLQKPITYSGFDAQELAVPTAMRGTTVALSGEAYHSSLIGMTAKSNNYTCCRLKATFIEAPE